MDTANTSQDQSGPFSPVWRKYQGPLGLGGLILYLLLLGLGTVGEVWDVPWILNLSPFLSAGN